MHSSNDPSGSDAMAPGGYDQRITTKPLSRKASFSSERSSKKKRVPEEKAHVNPIVNSLDRNTMLTGLTGNIRHRGYPGNTATPQQHLAIEPIEMKHATALDAAASTQALQEPFNSRDSKGLSLSDKVHRYYPYTSNTSTGAPPTPKQQYQPSSVEEQQRTAYTQMTAHVVCPLDPDILLGRGRIHRDHPGNKRLHILIGIYREQYEECASRDDKTALIKTIVRIMKGCGTQPGRFLKCDPNSNAWIQVNDDVARQKVGHAFRDTQSKPKGQLDLPATANKSLISDRIKNMSQPGFSQQQQQDWQLDPNNGRTNANGERKPPPTG